MAEFNKKDKYNFWHSPIMLLVLFCLLFIFMYNIFDLFKKERETANKKNIILSNIEDLREREKILSSDIEKLKTTEGQEEAIMEKYQVAKEGEKMVTIVDEEEENESEIKPKVTDYSFWGWIKNIFKK